MARVSLLSALTAIVMLSLVRIGTCQEAIAWTADLPAAQKSAAREGKLILLHFYSDNCRPCKTLERNVFSQRDIAAAVGKNYVPVKVHVDSMPRLAQRYQVEAWPTDVIVTSAGLEVFRTISPQSAEQYLTMLDQVAFQAGIGAGRLAGGNLLEESSLANRRGDVSLTGATAPAGTAAEQTGASNTLPSTTPPAPRYDQQAASQTGQRPSSSNPNMHEQRSDSRQPPAGAATGDGAPFVGGARYSPPADKWAGLADHQQAPSTTPQSIYADHPQPPPTVAAHAGQPPVQPAAANPGAISEPARSIYDPLPAPQAQAQSPRQPVMQPGYQPTAQSSYPPRAQPSHQSAVQPRAAQTPPTAQQTSAEFRSRQFVDASKAPPFAIEQFCPVTLLESKKWHKGNVRFGAVHRNRTYLFASADAQRRFLADPERYVPVLSGCDPVVFAETNQWIDGNPSIGLLIGGKTFFFVSAESRARFEISPQAYTARAYQGMAASRTR